MLLKVEKIGKSTNFRDVLYSQNTRNRIKIPFRGFLYVYWEQITNFKKSKFEWLRVWKVNITIISAQFTIKFN